MSWFCGLPAWWVCCCPIKSGVFPSDTSCPAGACLAAESELVLSPTVSVGVGVAPASDDCSVSV